MNEKQILEMDATTTKNVESWLKGDYDHATKDEIRKLLKDNPKEIVDAFYTNLVFGTGGLRGIMGVGCNRMNVYTVRAATQGLANHVNTQPKPKEGHSALIGYDSRHHSRLFAEEAAKVLAGNGIKVFLFKDLRPTPLVSFGCRLKKCSTAIMITASHNPPQYNGYKVYWNDGAQILPPHDKLIVQEVEKITDPKMVKKVDSLSHPLIQIVDKEIDDVYIKETSALQLYPGENQDLGGKLKIVYTSLYGTGITLMPEELAKWGFSNISYVDQQIIPNGDFPTTPSPNPEEKSALKLGIEKLKETRSDLLVATDPDADRVGVAVDHEGEITLMTGNQMAAICLNHICEALVSQGKMPEKAAFIKSIGTTELFQAICDEYKKPCFNVLTGFKYIAEKIREWEKEPNGYQYIFGGEESYGYLFGTLTRDKDAIVSSALICEVALHAKKKGKTLVNLLHDLYRKYGVYCENLISIEFEESKSGKEQMDAGMANLRHQTPQKILGIEIDVIEDYLSSTKTFLKSGRKEALTLPKSNVLLFWLADGTKLMIRPSGTEPKIKIYCGVVQKTFSSVDEAVINCQKGSTELLNYLKKLLTEKNL